MKSTPVYILIIVVLVLLLFKCNGNTKIVKEPYKVIHRKFDTIVRLDTVFKKDLRTDTIVKTDFDTIIKGVRFDFSEYHYKIKDSLLNATIIAKAPFKPEIDFQYELKTFNIKDSIVVEKNNYRGFLMGGNVSVSPLVSQMNLTAAYQLKKGDILTISAGRDFASEQNIYTVGYLFRF